jgi:hypothetical protein
MATSDGTSARSIGIARSPEVVEIGLLLPASWADALVDMSRRRGQTVAQLLRGMIDRALIDEQSTCN